MRAADAPTLRPANARPIGVRIASPNAPWIAAPLTTHPGGRVVVPGVLAVAESPGRRAQANRLALPLDRGQNRIADKGVAAPRASDGIYFGYDHVGDFNVHSHVCIDNT